MTQKTLFCCAILFSVLFLTACSNEPKAVEKSTKVPTNETKPLTKELIQFVDGYKMTVVLSRRGCTACNVRIVQLTNALIDSDAFGTVIETTGRNYDISTLLQEEFKDKIFKDYKSQLSKRFKSTSSYIVYHKNGIDGDDVQRVEITVDNMDKFEAIFKSYIKKAKA